MAVFLGGIIELCFHRNISSFLADAGYEVLRSEVS